MREGFASFICAENVKHRRLKHGKEQGQNGHHEEDPCVTRILMSLKGFEISCAVVLGTDRLYAVIAQGDECAGDHYAGHHDLVRRRTLRTEKPADKKDVDLKFWVRNLEDL